MWVHVAVIASVPGLGRGLFHLFLGRFWTIVLVDLDWASGTSDAMLFVQRTGCLLPLSQFNVCCTLHWYLHASCSKHVVTQRTVQSSRSHLQRLEFFKSTGIAGAACDSVR